MKLIEELDLVPSTYFKKMVNTDELWEVRAAVGSNIFRLIGFFDGSDLIILAHAFQKKTQKTPKQAIKMGIPVISNSDSEGSRTVIPAQAEHRFR